MNLKQDFKDFFSEIGCIVGVLITITVMVFGLMADIGHFVQNIKNFFNIF